MSRFVSQRVWNGTTTKGHSYFIGTVYERLLERILRKNSLSCLWQKITGFLASLGEKETKIWSLV